jgi:chitinase
VPYLFDPQRGVFISYDDPTSLAAKARHARNKALRGTMIWDLSSDTADHALLTALAAP